MSDIPGLSLRLFKKVEEVGSIVILLPEIVNEDNLSAGLALHLAVSNMGKNAVLVSSGQLSEKLKSLPDSEKLTNTLSTSGDTLMMSFPYTEGSVDSVTYNIDENTSRFNLLIAPQAGYAKLDPKSVSFSFTGGKADIIICLDIPSLNNAGAIYSDNQKMFTGVDLVNIDRHFNNTDFGSMNLVNKQASSISELVFTLLKEAKVTIDKDIATHLYRGIAVATNNFTSFSVNANTHESAAWLLKAGAQKRPMLSPLGINPTSSIPRASMPIPAFPTEKQDIKDTQGLDYFDEDEIVDEIAINQEIAPVPTIDPNNRPKVTVTTVDDDPTSAPQDWLKPKIFGGGTSPNTPINPTSSPHRQG